MAEENEEDNSEVPKKEEKKPPEETDEEFEGIREYDAEELKREIEKAEILEEGRTPDDILTQIQEERKRLEKEKAELLKEKEKIGKKLEKEEKEEKEEEVKPKPIKSFAKERKKRRELERLRTYLFAGEYVMLVVLILALLSAEKPSLNPFCLPIESSIYLITLFFLVMKVEKYYFNYNNIKYSGTVQRKAIGVEHFRAAEFPPMAFTIFVVAILLIPITSDMINVIIDMLTFERKYIPISSGFPFYLGILFIASLALSVGWILFLMRFKEKVVAPELAKISEPFVVDEIFVITKAGLLITHFAREEKPNVDDDILSSMLTAVGEFVKDSFSSSSEEGELDELQYGKLRIVLEYGKHVYLACVVRGQEPIEFRPEMKRTLKNIERRFERIFDSWDGDLGQLKGIRGMVRPLVG